MTFKERDQQNICLDATLIRCVTQASQGGFDFDAAWFGLVSAPRFASNENVARAIRR